MFNHQSLNPGYSGAKEYTNFTILHRSQWLNFEGAPESQAFTFNHKMTPKNIGFGISGVNDKIGPMTSARVALDVAYHLEFENLFYQLASNWELSTMILIRQLSEQQPLEIIHLFLTVKGNSNLILVLEFITIGQDGMQDSPSHGLLKMKALTYKDIIMVLWEE